jgi:hypothetical protein
MLMAYADGALSASVRAKVEAVLKSDAEARSLVEAFRATGTPLSKLYSQPMLEPVPETLKDFVLNYPLEAPVPKARRYKQRLAEWAEGVQAGARDLAAGAAGWLDKPAPQTVRWQFAAASAAIFAVGATAGLLLHGGQSSPDDFVAFNGGHIYASGILRDVLEQQPSGRDTRISGVAGQTVTMRATLTFKTKQQTYCREYEIATPGDRNFTGLGCRDHDGKWALEVHMPAKGAAGGDYKAAGGADNPALDAIVDRTLDGDVFSAAQESAAIGSGWK